MKKGIVLVFGLLLIISMFSLVSGKTVTGECGVCPQECIEHVGSCTFYRDVTCDAEAQSRFQACMSSGFSADICNAIATQYGKRSTCTYDDAGICYDTDGGKKEFWYGETTDYIGTEQDFCKTYGYHYGDHKYYWLYDQYETGYCKTGTSLWSGAGIVATCSVREYSCVDGITKRQDLIGCSSGICYNGRCACENVADCGGAGYKCVDDEGKGKFCDEIYCEDTDVSVDYPDGKNPNIFGIVTSEINAPTGTGDTCVDGDTVREYYCSEGQNWVVNIDCAQDYVCMGGVCVPVNCGDSIISTGEECDDGNIVSEDGCSSLCVIEDGWECVGEPSVCTPNCEFFTENNSCLNFQGEVCTWTPPGTTSNPEGGCCFGGGGNFEDAEEWSVQDQLCMDTATLCTGGLFRKEDFPGLYNRENDYGPGIDLPRKRYCAQVTSGIDYGFWYPTVTY